MIDIEKYIKELNKEELLPKYALRRNSPYYKFVSYLNNSLACFFSKNYKGLFIFIYRLQNELIFLEDNGITDNDSIYISLCKNYIKEIKVFLISSDYITDEEKSKLNSDRI